MTQHNSISATQLLSIADKEICTQLKNLDSSDASQRAAALLFINDGATQTEAAEKSGLTIGQIRYLVKRFKEKGIEMFPAELLTDQAVTDETAANEPSQTPSSQETPIEEHQEISKPQAIASEPEVETEPTIPKMVQSTKSKNTNRNKASKKRPKRPKPIKKKKKSKRKRKNRKQGN